MFNAFTVTFLDEYGAIRLHMAASDVLDHTPEVQAAVDFFADAIAKSAVGFDNLNLRVGGYPPVSCTFRPLGVSAAVASISSGDRPADLLMILSRKDRGDDASCAVAFKTATKDMYEPAVVDEMLGDIEATHGPIVVVARPPGPLQPKAELSLDRGAACLASAFLGLPQKA